MVFPHLNQRQYMQQVSSHVHCILFNSYRSSKHLGSIFTGRYIYVIFLHRSEIRVPYRFGYIRGGGQIFKCQFKKLQQIYRCVRFLKNIYRLCYTIKWTIHEGVLVQLC